VDHLAIGNWMFSAVNRDEDSPMPEAPEPVPRPGAEEVSEDGIDGTPGAQAGSPSPSELARFFA
jgi:hypothetical protein